MWIRDASREEKLPEINRLDDPRLFPYRWGHALWAYIAGRCGDDAVGSLYREALESGSAVRAIEMAVGLPAKDLSREWREAVRTQYDPTLKTAQRASTYGRLVSGETRRGPSVNVSPALSPDGTRIVYLSERSLLSVDLYLADVETGQIIRRLVNTAVNAHFTSLQFISSAGSWHPGGTQFVFGATRNGQPELAIVDVETGRTLREIPFPSLGEILNPSWSPNGHAIAFSATSGGFSDLFVYDLREESLRRLTEDHFADLQPAWSPEGRHVAFVTDRFSTDLPSLKPGPYDLALVDLATGTIDAVRTFDSGKSINPQWAADRRRLYFLSDRGGLTNIYGIDLDTQEVTQVTNLDAGVSGITALSPALSTAIDANRLAFSAYDHGQLGVYVIDKPDLLTAGPVAPLAPGGWPGALPPEQRASDELVTMLRDAATGLPETTGDAAPYRPRLSLDYVGQPYVGVGVSSFGPSFGGGIAFMWSDMLGNHNLQAAIDANTYGMGLSDLAKNTGGLFAYQNLTHRWNWGLAVEQSPYLAGGFLTGVTIADGQPALVEETIVQRQTYRRVGGAVAYPFSRTRRVEVGGGYANVSYDEQVRTTLTSLRTGRIIRDETVTTALVNPLYLGTASVAAVIDSSVFGATSPVAGERARFEIAPTSGSITFATAIADYRRYIMPVNFYTIAGRVLHVGRYGAGGEDSRLLPLFLGYPEFIRGYGIGSFTAAECTASGASSCQEFDRLLGSRMFIGNLEVRFPLLRPFGVRSGMYGPLPIEVSFFTDGGVAWNRGDRPSPLGGDRHGVSSAGLTFRVNLLGFAVAQIDLARPFQRPARGWVWSFSLTPGF